MHKTLRRTLFVFFIAVFVIAGAWILVTTQGLVPDWKNLKLVETGGIYIHSYPPDTVITLDGKPYKKPLSVFNRGTLIGNLPPKTYAVKITSPGRITWEKPLEVVPGLVTSASFIQLFETSPETKPLSTKKVDDFWLAGANIITKSGNQLFFDDSAIKGTDIVEASPSWDAVLTKDQKGTVYFIDLGNPQSALNVAQLFSSLLKSNPSLKSKGRMDAVHLHPFSPNELLIQSSSTIFSIDLKKLSIEEDLKAKTSGFFAESENEIFWISATGTVGYNLLLGNNFTLPSLHTTPQSVTVTRSGSLFFITDKNDTLTLYDRSEATSTKIADDVKEIALSPDERKLLIRTQSGKFFIYYAEEDATGDVREPKGALMELPVPPEYISAGAHSLQWMRNFPNYFAFLNGTTLVIGETDVRPPANAFALFPNIKKFSEETPLSFLTTDGTLSSVDFKF